MGRRKHSFLQNLNSLHYYNIFRWNPSITSIGYQFATSKGYMYTLNISEYFNFGFRIFHYLTYAHVQRKYELRKKQFCFLTSINFKSGVLHLSKLEIEVQNKRWFANKLQSYKIFKESCMARRRARNFAETKVMKEINIFCCHQPRGEKIKRIKEHCMSCAKNYLLKV